MTNSTASRGALFLTEQQPTTMSFYVYQVFLYGPFCFLIEQYVSNFFSPLLQYINLNNTKNQQDEEEEECAKLLLF